jgi:thiamine biosynthesis lipoprotein
MGGSAGWTAWGCDIHVVVADIGVLDRALAATRDVIAEVDVVCSRFRPDSELSRIAPELAVGTTVSPLLADLVGAALRAAAWTDGAVDPTLGVPLTALGYDRDFSELEPAGGPVSLCAASARSRATVTERRYRPAWREVSLVGPTLRVPQGVVLDLGATAKAVAADRAAARAAAACGCGVLVSLGGDIATAGEKVGGWEILVQDLPEDPAQQVHLASGAAMATSSTQKRRWQVGRAVRHHILDPRTLLPADVHWRTATVSMPTCLESNALSTAAIVRGLSAPAWLRDRAVPARLVDAVGRVVTLGGWPEPDAVATGAPTGLQGGAPFSEIIDGATPSRRTATRPVGMTP